MIKKLITRRNKIPRLSLYKPEKGQDYQFFDKQISEMFQIGGTDCYLHKYLGTKNPTIGTPDQPVYTTVDITNIQDLLFLENRDRKYDSEIYRIRGFYNVQNIDFNLSQFGLFIDNDTLFLTVHINDFIKFIGRKPVSGDVLELPHLKDDFALNDLDFSLPRYYVIEDVGRASEGFSSTWYPHLYRLKLKKITANQQFADIFNKPTGQDSDMFAGDYDPAKTYYPGEIVRYNGILYQVKTDGTVPDTGTSISPPDLSVWSSYGGSTLEDLITTRSKELEINDAVLQQAELDAPLSGYETRQYYTLAVDMYGKPALRTVDSSELNSSSGYLVSESSQRPIRSGYTGYLLGDGYPVNGYMFGHGIQFPDLPSLDDFFLRTDFLPNRLFRFDGVKWIKVEDSVRMTMTNNDTRNTLKTGFINNSQYTYVDELAFDAVSLTQGVISFNTNILYQISPYVVLVYGTERLEYDTAVYPTVIDSYTDSNSIKKIRINLPVVNTQQQTIDYSGMWQVRLYNHREAQRQSLSKALKPRADL